MEIHYGTREVSSPSVNPRPHHISIPFIFKKALLLLSILSKFTQ